MVSKYGTKVIHMMTVLLEYIDRLLQFSIKSMSIAINVFYIFPIILALCLILSLTHYAQNYAGIISGSLVAAVLGLVTEVKERVLLRLAVDATEYTTIGLAVETRCIKTGC